MRAQQRCGITSSDGFEHKQWSGLNLSAEACQAGSSEQLGAQGCLLTPQVNECSVEALLQQGPCGFTPFEGVGACQQVSALLCVL